MTEKQRTANTGFASGGVTCKLGTMCFYSSAVLVDSFVLRNPLRYIHSTVTQNNKECNTKGLTTQSDKVKNRSNPKIL